MNYSYFIARRYLRTRHRGGVISFLSIISIIGITIGVAALIITLSILGGFEKEIREKVIGFTAHIQLSGFQNQPLRNAEETKVRIVAENPEIASATVYVAREVMIRSRNGVDGAFLKGIDTLSELPMIRRHIVQGIYSFSTRDGIASLIVGRKLARKLSISIGDKVVVFGLTGKVQSAGESRVKQFRVTGIYETGMAEFDDIYIYTDISQAQSLFELKGLATGIDIMLHDVQKTEEVLTRLQGQLGYPYYPQSVFQLYRNLFTWVELQKKPTPIILGLIIIVAVVNIIGTLLMVVLEKTRSIGVLRTLGSRRSGVWKIFLYEGLFVGLIGTLLGDILAFILCWIQLQYHPFAIPENVYFMTAVPILLRPEYFIIVSCLSIVLCFFATLIPARLAARVNPIQAIRFV
ncbi:MAG: ABC transporter permease [Bacteroidota bacterium]